MNVALYPIPEICAMTRLDNLSSNPQQWLVREIKKGRFKARRVGRQWAMTASDIEYMLDQLATAPVDQEVVDPAPVGMPSIASMRRRRSA
jgi:hypothetical protein